MKSKLLLFFTIILLSQNIFSQSKEEIIKKYQEAVFYDENFEFDGKKLVEPELKNSIGKPSTCYQDKEPLDEEIKFYDCINKKDSREHDIIISDWSDNSFFVSYVNRYGMKNILEEVKTRAITTKIQNGKVISQCVCDFDTFPESVYQSVLDLKCHLINKKTTEILNALYTEENKNIPKTWNEFIEYLNSEEYKKEFTKMTKVVYNDIFTSINQNIMKNSYDKYKRYDKSTVYSTLDIIREFEKENDVLINSTNEMLELKPLAKEMGINFLSKVSRLGADNYKQKNANDNEKVVNLLELEIE
ncbi:hypothetical protein EVU94_09450 [Flavobacteriaceae bacterium 144Ye]|nr:hypothetical protein EVU94_09450 [Flavobacteriaceae bacterium 144Ye]